MSETADYHHDQLIIAMYYMRAYTRFKTAYFFLCLTNGPEALGERRNRINNEYKKTIEKARFYLPSPNFAFRCLWITRHPGTN